MVDAGDGEIVFWSDFIEDVFSTLVGLVHDPAANYQYSYNY